MEPATIITERRIISNKTKTILTWLGAVLLILAAFGTWLYQGGIYVLFPAMEEARIQALIDEQLAEYINNPPPFVFTIVPNATSTFKVPEPEEEDIVAITRDYEEARAQLPSELPEVPGSISQFVVGDMNYEEYLNNLPESQQTNWFQVHDEIRHLVVELNAAYQVPPLLTRIGTTTPVLYGADLLTYDSDRPLTYPSRRVVEGYVIAGLLSRLQPDLASDFETQATAYALEGIAYGHYSYRDLLVSKQLASDYLEQIEEATIIGE
ncbi:MAG: hypothetical protein RLZZ70_452 [Candidatus Parcubacteria bacterium]|jgi:hypothetical protein